VDACPTSYQAIFCLSVDMFKQVWSWAGKYRTADVKPGIAFHKITAGIDADGRISDRGLELDSANTS
jgi:fido (protein-threonine AMPylation protein)